MGMRGPKPGTVKPNSGQIKKGEVRNPGGKRKVPQNVKELIKSRTEEAVEVIYELMKDIKTPAPTRFQCATFFYEHTYGKARQPVDAEVKHSHEWTEVPHELRKRIAEMNGRTVEELPNVH